VRAHTNLRIKADGAALDQTTRSRALFSCGPNRFAEIGKAIRNWARLRPRRHKNGSRPSRARRRRDDLRAEALRMRGAGRGRCERSRGGTLRAVTKLTGQVELAKPGIAFRMKAIR